MATKIPEDVMKYFQQTGAEGGKARAAKYSKEQLSEWSKIRRRRKVSTSKPKKGSG